MKDFTIKLEELKKSAGVPDSEVSSEVESKEFSEEQVNIDVKDEASAREYGETLAKNIWSDKFDQKIFDGVFASALEECGENWDAVANYLKNVYSGSKNFSRSEIMKNFSERIAALEESVGLEPVKSEVQTPAEPVVDNKETESTEEVAQTQEGEPTGVTDTTMNLSETPAVVEEKNDDAPTTPAETTCPECGKKLVIEFSNLTDEEFGEIVKEAKEYSKYPDQYETEGDRIHAFSDWLQNSRFSEFCKEAIYKAFCDL